MTADLWLIPLAYLIGSIPFGLLIARASKGVDVRTVGSGNIGATNVLRAAGTWPAALTLGLDFSKGWIPVALARSFGGTEMSVAAVGLAAFFGHLYPIFLRLRGGKGVATGFGVLLGVNPKVAGLVAAAWLLAAAIGRYSSVAALVASAAAPFLLWRLDGRPVFIALGAVLAAFIVVRHRDNLSRLVAGQEARIGRVPRATDADLPRSGGVA
jgi:glycerol-3-phosphate acyltransferase PlsY